MKSKEVDQNYVHGSVLAFLAAMLWGVSGAFAQFLFQNKNVNPEFLVFTRMVISGIFFLIPLNKKMIPNNFLIWKNKKDVLSLLFYSIFGMLSVQITYFVTIKHSNAATATVLSYLAPVFIAIYYAIIERRLPATKEFVAIFFALLGTFLIATHGNLNSLSISKEALIWGIFAAMALAAYSILPIRLLNKYSANSVIGWSMLIGASALYLINKPTGVAILWDSETYIYTALVILLGTIFAFYAYLTAVKMVGAKVASLLACAEPLAASIIAVLWLNVGFTFFDWLGMMFIISTIIILSKK